MTNRKMLRRSGQVAFDCACADAAKSSSPRFYARFTPSFPDRRDSARQIVRWSTCL